jgi:UDP-N-acetylmuramate dehydrogenase
MADHLKNVVDHLTAAGDGPVKTNELLAPYTSYRIGGASAIWVAPQTESGLARMLEIIHADHIPLFILGRGTNVLVSDDGWPGVTLYLGENFSGWHFAGRQVEVRAGTRLTDLIQAAADRGLAGMELMVGIPGGVGGALRMNAGAFGQEIAQVTASVRGLHLDGRLLERDGPAVHFGYREARELTSMIITAARLRFRAEDPNTLKARMAETIALRTAKQPLDFPSCGSVFKRPAGYFAGALIEQIGMKGEQVGGAQVSRKHAGFILNVGNAGACDVYALIRRVEDRVLHRFGVQLQREVRLVGQFGEDFFHP